jgi:hypothetical protein
VQEKIEYVFDLVRFEKQVKKKFFKNLENTDEIRVLTTFKSIRIFRSDKIPTEVKAP